MHTRRLYHQFGSTESFSANAEQETVLASVSQDQRDKKGNQSFTLV